MSVKYLWLKHGDHKYKLTLMKSQDNMFHLLDLMYGNYIIFFQTIFQRKI